MELNAQGTKQRIEEYWDKSSPTYDDQFGHGVHSQHEKDLWLDLLQRNLPLPRGAKILDLGCGTGFLSLLLAELRFSVAGIDFSEEMRAKAAAKASDMGLSIDLRAGDVEAPDFPADSFDAIISRHVVWTLPDPAAAVAKWRSILRPGGLAVIIDGVWTPRTPAQRVRALLADGYKYLKGSRDHRAWKKKYLDDVTALPFFGGAEPDRVEELLASAGYTGLWRDAMDKILNYERSAGPFEYRLTHGRNRRYLIGGRV